MAAAKVVPAVQVKNVKTRGSQISISGRQNQSAHELKVEVV